MAASETQRRFDRKPSTWQPAHDALTRIEAAIDLDPFNRANLESLARQLSFGIDNADDGLLRMWLAEYRELIDAEVASAERYSLPTASESTIPARAA